MSAVVSAILSAVTLVTNLTPSAQNGNTTLGTLKYAPLPPFLNNSVSAPNVTKYGYPWGQATATNVNPYLHPPNSGYTWNYDFTIERGVIAPDGFNKSVLLVNGQYPGPLISANWGDTITVTVHNQITGPEEGTTIHWHGFLQKGTQYYDGVPAIQQCPIAPGSSFTYSFKADLFGTTWYHSHYSAQYSGGIEGPIIIYGPKTQPYDYDLGAVFVSDYYHEDYFTLVEQTLQPGTPGNPSTCPAPVESDNNLINGKMDVDCQTVITNGADCVPDAGLSKFQFHSGKTHRLRLINSGSEGIQRFSIDNHTLEVIANDLVPIQPYTTEVVTLGIGQRTDVLVKGTGSPTDAVWMRSNISAICSLNKGNPHALAAIFYEKANTTLAPKSTAWPYVEPGCGNDPLSETVPMLSWTPPATPATTQVIGINFTQNATGNCLWEMNNSSFRADYNDPILLLADERNTSYPLDPDWNVYDFGSNTSIRIIFYNYIGAAHPMHLHGHNFWVLAEGNGKWDGTVVNPQNPQRRDTQMLRNGTATDPGFIVLEFNADNPGVWPLHCHIAWHVSAGLYVNVMERPDLIPNNTKIPGVVAQTCTAWDAFTNKDKPDQIDSGV